MTRRRATLVHCLTVLTLSVCTARVSAAERVRPKLKGATPPDSAATETQSDAERIARLDRSLQSDSARLAELKGEVARPDDEYAAAETDFNDLDARLSEKKQQLSDVKANGGKPDRQLQNEVADLEKQRALGRDRFDLAIRDRKAVQESIAALEEKIRHDRQALDELRGAGERDASARAADGDVALPASDNSDTRSAQVTRRCARRRRRSRAQTASAQSPALPTKGAADAAPQPEASKDSAQPTSVVPAELAAASATASARQAAAQAAENEAHSIAERIEILRKNIELARQLRDTAHKKVDNADATLKSLNEELFRAMLDRGDTDALKEKIHAATDRVREARDESRQAAAELDKLQSTLAALQADQLAANRDAERKRGAAAQAAATVKELNNPFSVQRLMQWALDHGPRVLAMLVAVAVCLRLSRVVEARLVSLIARRAAIGNREERENRAKTLLGIFHNAANIVIFGGGVVAVLDEVGIPVAPLIGGAAVVGLAVAFGAQSLIKDYFTGFLVLLEHQYLVNDVVKIGAITGQVERITLRTTMLRDGEGHVHFIPHGQITTVTNTTHGWSRAVFEIRIGYRENVDRAIETLMQLARELHTSPDYAGFILDDPVMLGVESLAESAVVLKFHIKTRPLHQSSVRRELLRRIKNRFDELGIEIPSPQLTLHRPAAGPFGVVGHESQRRAS